MAIAKFKGVNGGTVLVNTSNIGYVDGRNTEKGPILGQTAIVLMNGQGVFVQGTPEEVYGILVRYEKNAGIELAQ